MEYTVHPGIGVTTPGGDDEYIDAGTLASLYGLSPGEYAVGGQVDVFSIHLFPRPDGKYRNIKTELGDNGQKYHYDHPAFLHKTRNGKEKDSRKIQPQYIPTFRDRDAGREDERII